jgi:periplasmic divalent cation tolerance protein
MQFSMLYITTANIAEAKIIAKTLVEEKLVACANCFDNMRSVYWWKGKIEESSEAVLTAKTRNTLVETCVSRIKELHSYKCPCIVSLPLQSGSPDYLKWLEENTKE